MHHELDTVHVAGLHDASRDEVGHVPAHFRAVTLVHRSGRNGITAIEVPVVLDRIHVGCDRHERWGVRVVHDTDSSFPGSKHSVWRVSGTAELPVTGATRRICGD